MGWVSEEVVVDAVNDEQRHSFDAQASSSKLERGQRVVSHAFKSLDHCQWQLAQCVFLIL